MAVIACDNDEHPAALFIHHDAGFLEIQSGTCRVVGGCLSEPITLYVEITPVDDNRCTHSTAVLS